MQQYSLEAEGRALLVGLQSTELNNQLVKVVKYLDDEALWEVRVLGPRQQHGNSAYLCVKEENLRATSPSSFLMEVEFRHPGLYGMTTVPLRCQLGKDGYGQSGIYVMYDDFLGAEALIPVMKACFYYDENKTTQEDLLALKNEIFVVPTSPCQSQRLSPNECVIVRTKHPAVFDALRDYECVVDTGRQAEIGMHRDCRICTINFPIVLNE
jgi:hypothetical protein